MSPTILLADDSVSTRNAAAQVFDDGAFELSTASSGDEALAAIRSSLPDVVVADVHMPGKRGYEVARATKDLSPETPVLLLVGTFEAFDEEEFAACGADAHLLKPFGPAELRAWVEEAVGAPEREEDSDAGEASPAAPELEAPRGEAAPPESGESEADEPGHEASPSEPTAPEARGRVAEGAQGDVETDLSPEDVDRVARRVVELISEEVVERVAREVVPEIAERLVGRRLAELEREAE